MVSMFSPKTIKKITTATLLSTCVRVFVYKRIGAVSFDAVEFYRRS